MSEDARIYRFHAHLGDFSACVCDALKEGEDSNSPLKRPWTTIVEALDQEDKKVVASEASNHTTRRVKTPMRDAIERRVIILNRLGHTDVDIDIALFAIRTYARRNFVAHGNTFGLYKSGDCAGLAQYPDDVDNTLEGVLPGVERDQVDMYRRLLTFYKDRHIQMVGTDWVTVDQLPAKSNTDRRILS